MAVLEVEIAGRPPFRVPIGNGEVTIGRAEGSTVQIIEPYISGRQAALVLRVAVRDLGSTNGTLYKGERIRDQVFIGDGETILLGGPEGARLTLRLQDPQPAAPTMGAARGGADVTVAAPPPTNIARFEKELAEKEKLIAELRARVTAGEADIAVMRSRAERAEEEARKQRSVLAPAPIAPAPTPAISSTELEALRGEIAVLETAVTERDGELGRVRTALAAAVAAAASAAAAARPADTRGADTDATALLGRLAELQEKLGREQKARSEAEAKLQILSKSGFSGAQEAVQMLEERNQKIAALERALAEGERRLAAAAGGAPSGAATSTNAREAAVLLFGAFTQTSGFAVEPALLEMMQERDGIFADLGFVLGKMYRFARDLEGVITRMAQVYRGAIATADETMIPGVTGNLSRTVNGLLLRGGDKGRKELETYLESLRVWSGICLTAYKSGAKQWCHETIQRIAPDKLQRAIRVPTWKKALGLEGWEYWRGYRKQMEDITPEIAEAQIDDFAATAAVELAKKQGIY